MEFGRLLCIFSGLHWLWMEYGCYDITSWRFNEQETVGTQKRRRRGCIEGINVRYGLIVYVDGSISNCVDAFIVSCVSWSIIGYMISSVRPLPLVEVSLSNKTERRIF